MHHEGVLFLYVNTLGGPSRVRGQIDKSKREYSGLLKPRIEAKAGGGIIDQYNLPGFAMEMALLR